MKNRHFYSHIIDFSMLSLELGDMELSHDERKHLVTLIEGNIHHMILDLVLSELSEPDKKIFLMHLAHEEHDKIWELLNKKIKNIERKIKDAAEDLKKEFYKDIKEARLASERQVRLLSNKK